ncbi:MAG: hypothetical protein H7A25_15985 [Leptospiraceae bacterium]|nr:hypothetical protein [Leptospiraceae bacterium]MCP5501402.1 hypothetical protein [Leptospiraceae bacterium]
MTETHDKHIDMHKIAHLLEVKEEEIAFLESHSHEELSFLTEKLSTVIQEEHSGIWEPLARVSKYMPNFINAKVSEEILGPQITANLTYYMPTKEAVSISNYFSVSFLSDVMEHVNPARVEEVIKASPMDRMKKVVMELLKRKKYFVVAGLIDHTPVNINVEVSKNISPEDLVELSDLITRTDVMAKVMEHYSESKNKEILLKVVDLNKEESIFEMMKTSSNLKSIFEQLSQSLPEAKKEKFNKAAKAYFSLET